MFSLAIYLSLRANEFFCIGIISFFFCTALADLNQSVYWKYDACKPRDCGTGPQIKYPFHILDKYQDFCGYPGFEVVCKDNKPLYKTSRGDYIIQNISYENQSLRLVNAEILNSSCIAPRKFFAFDRSPFIFSSTIGNLYLFYGCNDSFPKKYAQNPITCASDAVNHSYAVLDKGKDQVNCSAMPCESYVAAPVEIGHKSNLNGRHIDYVRLLEDGFTLQWSGIRCSGCERSGGHCGFENGEPVCYCSDQSHQNHCNSGKRKLGLIVGSVLGGAVLIFLLVTFIVCRYKKKHNGSFCFSSRNKSSDPSSENDVEERGVYHGVPVFSHTELEEATCKFDSSRELGDGGFGAVYYGKLQDGREVAVKRLYEHNCKRMEHFKNEVEILTRLKHRNLVTLYGCTSKHSRELLLVYEFISNGTVADHLHGDRAKEGFLAWPIRMNIAIETASALVYLHASDIIHRDVKTNNILLDNNCSVKVADFGLSRLFPNDVTHVSTAPQGTPGYVDPDYHECYQLTNKSDVYSFGVVLVELISSMPAIDITRHRQEINLSNLAINKIQRRAFDELIDPSLGFASDAEVKRMTTSVAELAFRCLQVDKDLRPTMDEVLKTLKIIQDIHSDHIEDEKADDSIINNTKPNDENAPTFQKADDKALLTKMQIPPSPISVTEKWVSSCGSTSSING